MSVTYQGPVRINRRQGATFDGSRPVNGSGLFLGDNTGAAVVSQEFVLNQTTAVAGNLPLYEVGVGGTAFVNGALTVPNVGQAAAQVIGTIPAGSRIQNISLNVLQSPGITSGQITYSLNGVAIANSTIGGTGYGFAIWNSSQAALQLLAYVGSTDAVLTTSLSGSAITGGLLCEISVLYTVRNANGSLTQSGSGQSF